MKKLIAFTLVLVLVLTLVATAFAAYPKATLTSSQRDKYVKRGKKFTYKYKLNCGSYKRVYYNGYWYYRANFDTWIERYGSKVSNTVDIYYTGKGTKKVSWKISKGSSTGYYDNVWRSFYRYNLTNTFYRCQYDESDIYVY